MSIADHFDHTTDAGFVRTYDSHAARRQFQVSLVLIMILTVAAFVLGLLVRFDEPTAKMSPAPVAHEIHGYAAITNAAGFWG